MGSWRAISIVPANIVYAMFCAMLCTLGCQVDKFDVRPARTTDTNDASARDVEDEDARVAKDVDASRARSDASDRVDQDAATPPRVDDDAGLTGDASIPYVDAALRVDAATAVDAGAPSSGPLTLTVTLVNDVDDALWSFVDDGKPLDEVLHFSEAVGAPGYTVEVGTDFERCQTGLRFKLDIPAGATIVSATLSLLRLGDDRTADPAGTMRVSVFESTNVEAFDHAHMHFDPSEHAPMGLWRGATVGGWHVGKSNVRTLSPDLRVLVQHAIDLAGWKRGGYVGFVIASDEMEDTSYAQYQDSTAGAFGPTLVVTYTL